MTPFGARDLRALCGTGVPVSFAGVSAYPDTGQPVRGLFDRPVAFKLQGEGVGGVESALPTLTLPCNAFATMPGNGDTVTLTDPATGIPTSYRVTQPTTEDDGAMLVYDLRRLA